MPVSPIALQPIAFFGQLSDESRTWASEQMEIFSLKRRQALLSGKGPFKGLGVVLHGRMQAVDLTLDGREVALKTTEQFGLFGQEDLMSARPVGLTWMAPSTSSVAVMNERTAREFLALPDVLRAIAADMAQQLNDQLQWQKILSATNVTAKLANWIVFAARDRAQVQLPTHAEVAWRLNTTRESVTRVLQRLQADGVLVREGGHWVVRHPAALRELATGGEK
jgi:CRP-like cAMP-binding protein